MSAPHVLVDHLFGEGVYEAPVTSMAQVSGKIYDPDKPLESQAKTPDFTVLVTVLALIALMIVRLYKKQ